MEGWYARPEGFEECVLVYDFGEVAFVVSLQSQTVVEQEVVRAEGCVCAPEIREMLDDIAARQETPAAE